MSLAASDDGTLVLTHRWTDGPCEASEGECVRYRRSVLGSPPGATRRGTEASEVAQPCEPLLTGGAWVAGTWFDGICSRHVDGRVAAHVFALRPSISYAAVATLHEGCTPLGVLALPRPAQGALVVSACADGRAATTMALDAETGPTLRSLRARIVCGANAGATLELSAGAAAAALRREWPLEAPTSRLESVLPDEIAAPRSGARAVWTGDALLVARPEAGGRVTLDGWACLEGRLARARR